MDALYKSVKKAYTVEFDKAMVEHLKFNDDLMNPSTRKRFKNSQELRAFLRSDDCPERFEKTAGKIIKDDICPGEGPIRVGMAKQYQRLYGFCDHPAADDAEPAGGLHQESFRAAINDAFSSWKSSFYRASNDRRKRYTLRTSSFFDPTVTVWQEPPTDISVTNPPAPLWKIPTKESGSRHPTLWYNPHDSSRSDNASHRYKHAPLEYSGGVGYTDGEDSVNSGGLDRRNTYRRGGTAGIMSKPPPPNSDIDGDESVVSHTSGPLRFQESRITSHARAASALATLKKAPPPSDKASNRTPTDEQLLGFLREAGTFERLTNLAEKENSTNSTPVLNNKIISDRLPKKKAADSLAFSSRDEQEIATNSGSGHRKKRVVESEDSSSTTYTDDVDNNDCPSFHSPSPDSEGEENDEDPHEANDCTPDVVVAKASTAAAEGNLGAQTSSDSTPQVVVATGNTAVAQQNPGAKIAHPAVEKPSSINVQPALDTAKLSVRNSETQDVSSVRKEKNNSAKEKKKQKASKTKEPKSKKVPQAIVVSETKKLSSTFRPNEPKSNKNGGQSAEPASRKVPQAKTASESKKVASPSHPKVPNANKQGGNISVSTKKGGVLLNQRQLPMNPGTGVQTAAPVVQLRNSDAASNVSPADGYAVAHSVTNTLAKSESTVVEAKLSKTKKRKQDCPESGLVEANVTEPEKPHHRTSLTVYRSSIHQPVGINFKPSKAHCVIFEVRKGTPAARSKLQKDMILWALNGKKLTGESKFEQLFAQSKNLVFTVSTNGLKVIRDPPREPEPMVDVPFYCCEQHGKVSSDYEQLPGRHVPSYSCPGKMLHRAKCQGSFRARDADGKLILGSPYTDENGIFVPAQPVRMQCSHTHVDFARKGDAKNGDAVCVRFCSECNLNYAEQSDDEMEHSNVSVLCNRCHDDFYDEFPPQRATKRGRK